MLARSVPPFDRSIYSGTRPTPDRYLRLWIIGELGRNWIPGWRTPFAVANCSCVKFRAVPRQKANRLKIAIALGSARRESQVSLRVCFVKWKTLAPRKRTQRVVEWNQGGKAAIGISIEKLCWQSVSGERRVVEGRRIGNLCVCVNS